MAIAHHVAAQHNSMHHHRAHMHVSSAAAQAVHTARHHVCGASHRAHACMHACARLSRMHSRMHMHPPVVPVAIASFYSYIASMCHIASCARAHTCMHTQNEMHDMPHRSSNEQSAHLTSIAHAAAAMLLATYCSTFMFCHACARSAASILLFFIC